jgi:hypothetical protein
MRIGKIENTRLHKRYICSVRDDAVVDVVSFVDI